MSERDSRSVDAIDELAPRVLLGVPESGDGEKLGRLLADCPEARERFLDHATIQSFLAADLIDEMILTTIPILLGGGTPLFGSLPAHQPFDLVSTQTHLNQITTTHYQRQR